MTTEAEARDRGCPVWTLRSVHVAGCAGARCMAWRWLDAEVEIASVPMYQPADALKPPPGEGWTRLYGDGEVSHSHLIERGIEWVRPRDPATRRGFCGLAGPPIEEQT